MDKRKVKKAKKLAKKVKVQAQVKRSGAILWARVSPANMKKVRTQAKAAKMSICQFMDRVIEQAI